MEGAPKPPTDQEIMQRKMEEDKRKLDEILSQPDLVQMLKDRLGFSDKKETV